MSNPDIKPATSTTTPSTPPTKATEALDLLQRTTQTNPLRNVEVTVGAKYGDGVTISTQRGDAGPFLGGLVAGLALAGIGAAVGFSVWKARQPSTPTVKVGDK